MTPESTLSMGDLFAGIGGFSLGFRRAGFRVAWQVEIEEFPRRVLAHHFPEARLCGDITEDHDLEPVDVICGGFPCQGISAAGKGRGFKDDRSALWWWMFHVIDRLRPRWLVIENVPALRSRGADRVQSALERIGYTVRPNVVGAWSLGSSQRRDRTWMVAYATSEGRNGRRVQGEGYATRGGARVPKDLLRLDWPVGPRHVASIPVATDGFPGGLAGRAVRLKAIGNAVVPQIPHLIACWIRQMEAA